jgi:hypothetical protein
VPIDLPPQLPMFTAAHLLDIANAHSRKLAQSSV